MPDEFKKLQTRCAKGSLQNLDNENMNAPENHEVFGYRAIQIILLKDFKGAN